MLPQRCQRLFFNAGDLNLGDPQYFCGAVLCEAVIVAQIDDGSLPLRKLRNGLAQRNPFQDLLLLVSLCEDIFQRKTVLAGCPLD